MENGEYTAEDFRSVKGGANPTDAGSVEADEVKAQRLEKLAAFQLQMILHAFKCELKITSRLS